MKKRVSKKVISPMSVPVGAKNNARMFIDIEVFESEEHKSRILVISGVEGPTRNGNCRGSYGYIKKSLLVPDRRLSKDWTPEMVDDLYNVWDQHHSNDTHLECTHQREAWGDVSSDCEGTSIPRCNAPESLHPDGVFLKPCPVCGHEYGNKMLFEAVPDEVFDFLDSLPETTIPHPWG